MVVAFAGHGVQFKNGDESYFCPMDAKLADKTTLVPFSEVCRQLDRCKASSKLLLVDACRNDPLADEARGVDKLDLESVTRPQEKVRPGGAAVFFSCSAGEKAFEDQDLKHGVFFHFVIEGLRGDADLDQDGTVVLPELELYTKKQVQHFVADKYQSDQKPDLIVKTNSGLAPLVTVSRERASLSAFVESANDLHIAWHGDCDLYAVSPDGKTVVLVKRSGDNIFDEFLSIWDVSSKKEIVKLPKAELGRDRGVAFSSDAKWVANEFTEDATTFGLRVYDLAAAKVRVELKGNEFVGAIAFASDGSLLWLKPGAKQCGDLRRLDSRTGAHLPVFPGGEEAVSDALAMSANGEVMARVVGGKKLEIWDVAKGKKLSQSPWPGAEGVYQFLLAPDGKSLLFPSGDSITIWDTASGQARCKIPMSVTATAFFMKTAFCSDGKTLIVRYDDEWDPADPAKDRTRLKFFDLATGKERPNSTPLDHVNNFALSCDGAKLATLHRMPKNEWLVKVGDLPMSVRRKP